MTLAERLAKDVDRAVRRGRNGLRYAAGTHRPAVGTTPKDVVWERDKAQLWRYRRTDDTPVAYSPPLVIVHSLVSRSYVLDLRPGNSAVAFLRDAGLDVLLVDWGVADEVDAGTSLTDYVDDLLPEALDVACEVTGSDELTVLGYCFGGVLSLLTAARHSLPIRNLMLMATPVDFDRMEAITALVRTGRVDPGDLLDDTGNVPPEAIERSFKLLKPTADAAQYATLWQHLWNDEYVEGYQAMAQWVGDHVPFPGEAFRETVELLIRNNGFITGDLRLGGRDVDLAAITCPVLNIVAEKDHIVPIGAAEPIPSLVGSPDAGELRLPAGHVGLVAGRAAAKVTLPRIAQWVQEHSDRA